MRLEYGIEIDQIETPRFAVEAVEGIGKLFTLATAVLNVIESKKKVEVVFHGLNPEDPERKIRSFREILASSSDGASIQCEEGVSGRVASSSSSYQWLTITRR